MRTIVEAIQQLKALGKLQGAIQEIKLDLSGLLAFEAQGNMLELQRPGCKVSGDDRDRDV